MSVEYAEQYGRSLMLFLIDTMQERWKSSESGGESWRKELAVWTRFIYRVTL